MSKDLDNIRAERPGDPDAIAEHRSRLLATIRPVPRPRGELSETAIRVLVRERERLEREQQKYRALVVSALEQGSFSEVSKATGLSTNTLQRWKREASRESST